MGRRRGPGLRPGLATRLTAETSLSQTSLSVCAAAGPKRVATAKQKTNNRVRIISPLARSFAGSSRAQKLFELRVIRRYGASKSRQPAPQFFLGDLEFRPVVIAGRRPDIIN